MLGRAPALAVATSGLDPATARAARESLDWYLTRFGVDARPFAAARYEFVLEQPPSVYGGDTRFPWTVVPREGVQVTPQFGSRSKRYTVPQHAIEAIPDDPDGSFRGMAWEEWQAIRQRGHVESFGAHNLDQPGLTFFGDASQATSYAGSFASLPYKPGARRPGVVIQVPRGLTLEHTDEPDLIPVGERAVRGQLSIEFIETVWLLTPYEISYGSLDTIVTVWAGQASFSEGSRADPSVWSAILQLDR